MAMTYEAIVQAARDKFYGIDVSDVQGVRAFQINIEGKAVNGIFYIEIKDGKVNVEPYEYYDRNAIITVNPTNFIKLISGKLDPVVAFTTGKLKVDGDVIAKAKGRDIFLVGVEANYREDGTKLSEYDIIGIYIDKDKNYRVIANETYSMLEKEDVDEEAQQKLDDTVEQLELMNAFDDQNS